MKRVRKKILKPGLYKLTNPIGEIYIGQTKNLDRRIKEHLRYSQKEEKCPRILKESLVKYGFEAHTFEIIIELPKDVDRKVLKDYEYFIYCQYAEAGITLLNIAEGGTGKIMNDESRKIMSESSKKRWTPEFKIKYKKVKTGIPIHSQQEKDRRSKWLKDNVHKFNTHKFTSQDVEKSKLSLKKKYAEKGYIVPPSSLESGRQKKSKIILNTQNGVFYFGCKEAGISINHKEDNLRKKLIGKYKNNTPLILI